MSDSSPAPVRCPWRETTITVLRCVGTKIDAKLRRECEQAACPRLKLASTAKPAGPDPEPEAPATVATCHAGPDGKTISSPDFIGDPAPASKAKRIRRDDPNRPKCSCGCGEPTFCKGLAYKCYYRERDKARHYKSSKPEAPAPPEAQGRVHDEVRADITQAEAQTEAQTLASALAPAPAPKAPAPAPKRRGRPPKAKPGLVVVQAAPAPPPAKEKPRVIVLKPAAAAPALICRKCHQPADKLNAVGWCGGCAIGEMNTRKAERYARSADPLGTLLKPYPALLERVNDLAREELRTPEAQVAWIIREYLALHEQAVRLAAQEAAS